MTTPESFLALVIAALERAGIPSMVTGSLASSARGEARSTRDVDIVIAPTAEQLRVFVKEFPRDRYDADEEDALDALRHTSQFNVIDIEGSWKADSSSESRATSVGSSSTVAAAT